MHSVQVDGPDVFTDPVASLAHLRQRRLADLRLCHRRSSLALPIIVQRLLKRLERGLRIVLAAGRESIQSGLDVIRGDGLRFSKRLALRQLGDQRKRGQSETASRRGVRRVDDPVSLDLQKDAISVAATLVAVVRRHAGVIHLPEVPLLVVDLLVFFEVHLLLTGLTATSPQVGHFASIIRFPRKSRAEYSPARNDRWQRRQKMSFRIFSRCSLGKSSIPPTI